MFYFNGEFIASNIAPIDISDRGLLLADGLFETLKAIHGRIIMLDKHFERLAKSAKYLELPLPFTCQELEIIINELLDTNHLLDQISSIRLTLTRGPTARGLNPVPTSFPSVLITASPYTQDHSKRINAVIVNNTRINQFSPLATMKTLSYLDNLLARREAVTQGADEAILLNTAGHIACASAGNIFMFTDDDTLVTPPLSDGVLPGIMRAWIIDRCSMLKFSCVERSITAEEFVSARGFFITNSLVEIQRINSLNKRLLPQEPKLEQMILQFDSYNTLEPKQ